jgi:hypothetical protein
LSLVTFHFSQKEGRKKEEGKRKKCGGGHIVRLFQHKEHKGFSHKEHNVFLPNTF